MVIVNWNKRVLLSKTMQIFKGKKQTFAGRKCTHKCTYCHFVIKNIKLLLLNSKKKGHIIHQIKLSKEGTRSAMDLSLFSHYIFDLLLALF